MGDFLKELRSADSVVDVLMDHRKESLQLAVLAVVLLLAVLLYLHHDSDELAIADASGTDRSQAQQEQAEEGGGPAAADGGESGLPVDTDGIVYVDIGGAVKHPMLAELPSGSRVEDAIQAAGGLTGKADLSGVNRAQVLTDGEKVYIPEEGEEAAGSSGAEGGGNTAPAAGQTAAGISGGRININTADAVLLQQITGVGPVTAQKIVDYREQNGKFSNIEDLKKVSGIGEKTFEKMKDDVTI